MWRIWRIWGFGGEGWTLIFETIDSTIFLYPFALWRFSCIAYICMVSGCITLRKRGVFAYGDNERVKGGVS